MNEGSGETVPAPAKRARRSKKWLLVVLGVMVVVVIILCAGAWLLTHKNSSPVPKSVSQAVNVPIYYPDQKKLPAGYTLDLNSFKTPVKNGVTYTVSYDNGKKIVFSVQAKPSDNELQTFQANYLPLKTEYQTGVGRALIGAYNQKAFISLPTDDGPWLIITAPGDINQDQLKQLLSAIKV